MYTEDAKSRGIQLFRERLSEKVHATIPKVSWVVLVHCFSKKFQTMAREAMDVCFLVLKESNKSRFDSYSVRNSVLIISHITFLDCRVHSFSDNLSRNSCICGGPIQGIAPVETMVRNVGAHQIRGVPMAMWSSVSLERILRRFEGSSR